MNESSWDQSTGAQPEPATGAGVAVIDWSALRSRVSGGDFEVRELARLLLDQCAQSLADVRHAWQLRDARLLRRVAHTLKGSARYFGAAQVVQAARDLELSGRANNFDLVPQQLDVLADALGRLIPELTAVVGRR